MNRPRSDVRTQSEHCSDMELQVLLFEEPSTDAYRFAAAHLEQCEDCRAALVRQAADEALWNELPKVLDSTLVQSIDTEGDGSNRPVIHHQAHEQIASRSSNASEGRFSFLGAPSHPELLGTLGRYDVESFLGSGGMGIVFKAFDNELHRPVAIKCLAPYLAHNATARHRFSREGRAAAAVVHENVVAIHNVESNDDTPFIVMQFVPGSTVQTRVDADGPMSLEAMLRIVLHAARGLEAAHAQGVIHRDIKPGNLLLEANCDRAMVTDFGLARAADDASLTQSGIVSGTPNFMSPEQARGDQVDERSDLFSLGAVLYFMAAGVPPFQAERMMSVLHRVCHEPHRPLGRIRPELPWEFIDFVDKLLEKRPARRFQDAGSVANAAATLLASIQQPKGESKLLRILRRTSYSLRRPLAAIAKPSTLTKAIVATPMLVLMVLCIQWSIPFLSQRWNAPRETVSSNEQDRSQSLSESHPRQTLSSDANAERWEAGDGNLDQLSRETDQRIREVEQDWNETRKKTLNQQDSWRIQAATLDQRLRALEGP